MELEKKHMDLLQLYAEDLKEIEDIFNSTKNKPKVNKNSAPYSGESNSEAGFVSVVFAWCFKLQCK